MTILLLCVDELAALIHKSPASVRSDASRNPTALPPVCRLPGNKRLLWRLTDVNEWIAGFVQPKALDVAPTFSVRDPLPAKRGRPRKTELRA